MKLILRKNDSATSLLLFIYNNYYSKTSKDSLKLLSLLEIMQVFDKSEAAIRMSLSRAIKSGVLISCKEGEVNYSLSTMGKQFIELWNAGANNYWNRYQMRNLSWNGKWHFINIDFTNYKEERIVIIDYLMQLGYILINTNTWISPYYQKHEIDDLISKYNLKSGTVEILGEMNIRENPEKFYQRIYPYDTLKERYTTFKNVYSNKLNEVKKISKSEPFIKNGLALPILHELGWDFYSIVSDDPVLPKDINSHWIGDEAASIMKELRELLLDATWKYLSKFE